MSDDETQAEPRMTHAPGGVDVRDPLPRAIRDPAFPASVRGYDRRAVDTYVERVNRLIAELQVSGSPKAAVRHALERVGEQTSGILQRARETAEEITTGAREEAEETTARARAEAAEIVADARREAGERLAAARAEADDVLAAAQATAEDMLTRARDESDTAIARARIDAEGRVRRAEEEAAAVQEQAAARMRALQGDIAAITDERRRILDGLERLSRELAAVVSGAEAERVDDEEPSVSPAEEPVAVSADAPAGA
jgi:cell division septum initiation protein DivIVA